MTTGGVTVDVCAGGCGGMWFDWLELDRVDERHETGEGLLEVRRDPTLGVDPQKRISCPLDGEIMMRRFRSVRRKTIVDECPRCAGFWLHFGELVTIRQEFDTTEEREEAALEYYSEMLDPDLAVKRAQTRSDLKKARKVAHAFRFICPSYYMPGKQDWGAFQHRPDPHQPSTLRDARAAVGACRYQRPRDGAFDHGRSSSRSMSMSSPSCHTPSGPRS